MSERNFKQIGKLQFSVDIPIDSDLLLAIKLAVERRDDSLENFVNFIKEGADKEDREKILDKINSILEINYSIKLMQDAAIAVRLYKLDVKNSK